VEDCNQQAHSKTDATGRFANYPNLPRRSFAARNLALLLCCVLIDWGQASAAKHAEAEHFIGPDPTAGSTFVGAETCKGCHAEVYDKQFAGTPHAALTHGGKHGCEDCHGAGSAHVDGGGDKTKIFSFAGARPENITMRCMGCHESHP